jgi:hypothetical protein
MLGACPAIAIHFLAFLLPAFAKLFETLPQF